MLKVIGNVASDVIQYEQNHYPDRFFTVICCQMKNLYVFKNQNPKQAIFTSVFNLKQHKKQNKKYLQVHCQLKNACMLFDTFILCLHLNNSTIFKLSFLIINQLCIDYYLQI